MNNLQIKKTSPMKGHELCEYLKSQIDLDDEFEPEWDVIEILQQNPETTEFSVSNDAAEILPETYPEIFQ